MRRTTGIGIVLIALGVLVGGGLLAWTLMSVGDRVDRLVRVDVPGTGSVQLPAGKQVVYAEFDGSVGKREARPRLAIDLDGPSGLLSVDRYGADAIYNLSGRHGRAIATVNVPVAGDYRVSVGVAGGGRTPSTIAIGPTVMGVTGFVLPLVGGILALAGGLVAGILTIVLPRRLRHRASAEVPPTV